MITVELNNRKMKSYAMLGVLGGVLFMIGDCLIYCYKGFENAGIDPLWSRVGEWRFILSTWLGFVGMALLLPAFLSFYAMVVTTCGKKMRVLASLALVGIASSGFLHFSLGSLLPITYKAALNIGNAEIACSMAYHLKNVVTPINIVLFIFLVLEYLVHFIVTAFGKAGLPRWLCLFGPLGTLPLGMIWKLLLKGTAIEGAWGACESLAETLIFLTVYFYWNKAGVKE